MHRRRGRPDAEDKEIVGDLFAEGNAAEGWRARGASEYAETLTYISQRGEAALYHGPLGDILARLHERGMRLHHPRGSHALRRRAQPIRADYRGWQFWGRRRRASGCISHRCQHSRKAMISQSSARLGRHDPLSCARCSRRLRPIAPPQRRSRFINVPVEAPDLQGLCR